ncbi:MAG TPA: MFS transporter [Afifellaceae bacterium]|nr:MFS transporter [Afifellaceae bacterium]
MRGLKFRSISCLVGAEIAVMSLWFISAAILPDMVREVPITAARQAFLSSAVQAGFVAGAMTFAIWGIADRFDPRRVFALCSFTAALINAALLVLPVGGALAIAGRFATGALLAGVYPVGMKIAVGWGTADRGFLVGLLVGALTLGSASPHLAALLGGADWRSAVIATSAAAAAGGLMVLATGLGPHHARAAAFDPRAILIAWTDRRIRLAYAGYLGHMWELYAMWAWIGLAAAVSYSATMAADAAGDFAKLTAFLAIGLGGIASIVAGLVADRIGKAEIAIIAMAASGTAALATAASFGGPAWLTFVLILVWGTAIVPDSAQFSALVADAAPPEQAGSLLSLQTALGFTLTAFTVQLTPVLAERFGWPALMAGLAVGPAYGIVAMMRLRRIGGQRASS